MPPEVGAIGERLNARYVVLAATFQDKKGRLHGEVQAWDVRTKNRLRGVEVDFGKRDGKNSPDAAADQAAHLPHGRRPAAERTAGAQEPLVSSDSVLRKPWFWAAAAGVAAVTAGVVYVATTRPRPRASTR